MAYVSISIPDHLLERINALRVRYAHNMEPQHICLMRIVKHYEETANISGSVGLASQREEASRERAERAANRRDSKRAGRSDIVTQVMRRTHGRSE